MVRERPPEDTELNCLCAMLEVEAFSLEGDFWSNRLGTSYNLSPISTSTRIEINDATLNKNMRIIACESVSLCNIQERLINHTRQFEVCAERYF